MNEAVDEKAEFTSQFAKYSRFGNKLPKAIDVVLDHGVKRHVFLPSKRVVFSVVGREGDDFVDPVKPYCSCDHFFFRVLGGKDELCYHILSYKIAQEARRLDTVTFSDEEYRPFVRMLLADVLDEIGREVDKET
jgi:predicted nucleic acid-binding Zn finger protein